MLPKGNRAVVAGRTVFKSRRYKVTDLPRVLVSGFNNRKIGRRVEVGRWAGYPIFTLTLEERATCTRSCFHWRSCYGNNMQWARRIKHGPELEEALESELLALDSDRRIRGFVVRLHVLGDFYSVDYVRKWERWLDDFQKLRVFGYTAWKPGTPIGDELDRLRIMRWDRFAVRLSTNVDVIGNKQAVPAYKDALGLDRHNDVVDFVCPAQVADKQCATCAACWESKRNVGFLGH